MYLSLNNLLRDLYFWHKMKFGKFDAIDTEIFSTNNTPFEVDSLEKFDNRHINLIKGNNIKVSLSDELVFTEIPDSERNWNKSHHAYVHEGR